MIQSSRAEWGPARPIVIPSRTAPSLLLSRTRRPLHCNVRGRQLRLFHSSGADGKAREALMRSERTRVADLSRWRLQSLEASRLGLNSRLGKCCTKAAAGRHEFLPLKLLLRGRSKRCVRSGLSGLASRTERCCASQLRVCVYSSCLRAARGRDSLVLTTWREALALVTGQMNAESTGILTERCVHCE